MKLILENHFNGVKKKILEHTFYSCSNKIDVYVKK